MDLQTSKCVRHHHGFCLGGMCLHCFVLAGEPLGISAVFPCFVAWAVHQASEKFRNDACESMQRYRILGALEKNDWGFLPAIETGWLLYMDFLPVKWHGARHIYIYTNIHIYIHIYIYTYMHIYIHTYTYMSSTAAVYWYSEASSHGCDLPKSAPRTASRHRPCSKINVVCTKFKLQPHVCPPANDKRCMCNI